MKSRISQWIVTGALTVGVLAGAQAQNVKPTVAGRLVSLSSSGVAELRTESGKVWKVKLTPQAHFEVAGKSSSRAAFQPGMQVAFRIVGSMGDSPLQSDLLVDWGSSNKYVATTAPAPYFTQKGEYATTNGVGGAAEGAPAGQRPDKTIGILGNGGQVSNSPGQNGAIQSTSPGTRMAQAYNLDSGVNPAGMPATNLMNGGDEENGTGGPPSTSSGGPQQQFQAKVLEAAPGGRSMRVQVDSQMYNVMIPGNVNPAALRPGQLVMITGTLANGYIEASQVVPVGAP